MNNNNNKPRVGDQDLNPLSGFQPLPSGNASSSMTGGIGGNQVGPNNPIFNNPSALGNQPHIIPGSRFDPVHPNDPFGGAGSGGNRGGGSSSSSFGNINPGIHKPPQFEDEDF